MELQYLNALEEYNLDVNDLPEDAQIGIEQINNVITSIQLCEKKGTIVKEATFKKLKAMDKWVYYEILDSVNETDKNEDEIPFDEEEIIEELNEPVHEFQNDEEEEDDDDNYAEGDKLLGDKIENDFEEMFKSGKTSFNLDELKSLSKTAYDVIFNSYEEDEDNGIETTNFSLIETSEYQFTLTKK
jgi:hypothetical protein